jgi:8-oxo-dGTP diphosphatase
VKAIPLAGCVILQEDAILLLHRISRNWYELPGGKIRSNESPRAAAIREVYEELGCTVELIGNLGSRRFTQEQTVYQYHWFLARITSGTPRAREQTVHNHCQYVPLQQLEHYQLSPNMKNLLSEIQEGPIQLDRM